MKEKSIFMCAIKNKYIAFVCAMQMEMDAIIERMDEVELKQLSYMKIAEGLLSGKKCVVALSGVGKVNAAMSTTMLIDHYDLEALINVGVAGGLKEYQNVGDIVISSHVVEHDFDTSPIDGEEGIGIKSNCDEELINKCIDVLENMKHPYYVGESASGDVFVTRTNYLNKITSTFPNSLSTEMEAGAIAHVCANANVRALIIRSLSDITVRNEDGVEFITFAKNASHTAAKVAQELMKVL